MAKNRDWQEVLIPAIAREFYDEGVISREFLYALLLSDEKGDDEEGDDEGDKKKGGISTSDKQALKKYRDWVKAQVLTGKVCLVGGKDGPTATKKALSSKEAKSAVLSFDALESAIVAAGGSVEGGRGRKPKSLNFDFLDDDEDSEA